MPGPMEGVRVVELGFWVAGPSAGGILADWGADVVKIEPPDGDPFRGLFLRGLGVDVPINPPFELDNRRRDTDGGRRRDAFQPGVDRDASRRPGERDRHVHDERERRDGPRLPVLGAADGERQVQR